MTLPGRQPDPEARRRWRVRVLPAGRAVIGGAAVSYALGIILGYPGLSVVAAGGAVGLAVAVVAVAWRPKVSVKRTFSPSSVVVGEPAVAVVEVANQARTVSPPMTVADHVGDETVELAVRAQAPGHVSLVRYRIPTGRRGRLVLGPIEVVRQDPLGLLRAAQVRAGQDVLWVHPRIWPMAGLPAGLSVELEGSVSETSPAGSLTFASLREYRPGDDRRMIHWRSSARAGSLVVRHHVDSNEPRATVVVDARPGVWAGDDFEEGIEVAASAVRSLTGQGHRVDLRIVGEDPVDQRQLGIASADDRLAAAGLASTSDPELLLRLVESGVGGGALMVVSGRLETPIDVRVAAQKRRFSPVVVCSLRSDRAAGWTFRQGSRHVNGPDGRSVVEAWNRMVGR